MTNKKVIKGGSRVELDFVITETNFAGFLDKKKCPCFIKLTTAQREPSLNKIRQYFLRFKMSNPDSFVKSIMLFS